MPKSNTKTYPPSIWPVRNKAPRQDGAFRTLTLRSRRSYPLSKYDKDDCLGRCASWARRSACWAYEDSPPKGANLSPFAPSPKSRQGEVLDIDRGATEIPIDMAAFCSDDSILGSESIGSLDVEESDPDGDDADPC